MLTANIFGQTKNETPKAKKVKSYDIKKDEYQFMAGYIVGNNINYNTSNVKGLSTAYFRNVYDRYSVGVSLSTYQADDYNKYEDKRSSYYTTSTNQTMHTDIKMIMLENRMRMNRAQRTHRFAGYAGFGIGYMINHSSYYSSTLLKDVENNSYSSSGRSFQNKNSVVVKANIQFKLNVSKNSGFLFENSISVYNNQYKKYYSSYPSCSSTNNDKGLKPFITFKAGYFF